MIFIALCGNVSAAFIWTATFIAMHAMTMYRPIIVAHVALLCAACHVALARVASTVEWEPDFDSFSRVLQRLRR